MRTIPLLLLLAGCATTRPCPPNVQIQTVEKPVAVACVKAVDVPAEPASTTLTGDARKDADLLGAKVSDLRTWGRSLVGMLKGCE
jgi:hypothetical protein